MSDKFSMSMSMSMSSPKVSIIIATCNCSDELEQTIISFIEQDYENKELIVIDCASTDETSSVLKKYTLSIDQMLSENDKGISDAFNKGIKLATGDYINFQGSGDLFNTNNVLTKMLENIDKDKDLLLCGRVKRVANDPEQSCLWISEYLKNFKKSSLLFKMSLPHQGLFTHKKLFAQYGLFDVNNHFCMDYEHLLRYYSNFPKLIGKNIIVSNWKAGGVGNGRILEIYDEYDAIKRHHKVAPVFILAMIKQWILFKFYIKKYLFRISE